MFPTMPSLKIAYMVPLHLTGGPPELQIRNLLNASYCQPLTQIQNIFTELFLIIPSIKSAQMVTLR